MRLGPVVDCPEDFNVELNRSQVTERNSAPAAPDTHMISKPARKNRSAHRPLSTCRDEVSLISDYLTNNLSRSERLAFENHLSACRDCGAFLATYKKTIELSRSFLRGPLPNQPPLHLTLRP